MDDQKTIDVLKKLIRKQIAESVPEGAPAKQKSMHEMAVDLAKAASNGIKALSALKNKAEDMPSSKAKTAVTMHIDALEEILNNMWQTPLDFLDSTPEDVVTKRRNDLDTRSASHDMADRKPVMDHEVHEGDENKTATNVLSDPTHCGICGTTYDKKLQLECPKCSDDVQESRVKAWADKLRSRKQ